MSTVQWEYEIIQKLFCEQMQAMGWKWLEDDIHVPELTERANFREALLTE